VSKRKHKSSSKPRDSTGQKEAQCAHMPENESPRDRTCDAGDQEGAGNKQPLKRRKQLDTRHLGDVSAAQLDTAVPVPSPTA